MKRLVPVVLGVVVAGCFEVEQEFTLNPDGSGKVVVHWVGRAVDVLKGERDPDERVAYSIRRQLEDSKGIECWTDVSWKELQDGRIEFTGTAYFRDLKELKIDMPGAFVPVLHFALTKGTEGLELAPAYTKKEETKERAAPPANDAEMRQRMRGERLKYRSLQPMLEGLFARARTTTVFNLPAEVATSSCFTKRSPQRLELTIDGRKLLAAYEAVMMDDARLAAQIAGGADFEDVRGIETAFAMDLFGEKGPIRAGTRGEGRALVDFEKELTKEKRDAYRKLCRTLDVTLPAPDKDPEPVPDATTPPAELLRRLVVLDLSQSQPLRCTAPDEIADLADALQLEGYRLEIRTPSREWSARGQGRFRLVSDFDGIREFELRPKSANVSLRLRQDEDGAFELTVDGEGLSATLLSRGPRGAAFTILKRTVAAGSWTSWDEALKRNPGELAEILDVLEALPITIAVTRADRRAIRLAAAWHEGVGEAERNAVRKLVERLAEDDVAVRDAAAKDLREWAMGGDLQRIRLLVLHLAAAQGEPRTRLEGVLAAHERSAAVVRLVEREGLHRDLPYLGAALETERDAGRGRLLKLTGVEFASRAEFDAWHAKVKDRLEWDDAKGRYRVKE